MTENYFKIFDFEEKIDIDQEILEEKYLEFQRNFHPDKAGIKEVEKSILINEAYDTLKEDFARAAHILKLNGIDIENDEKAPKVDFEILSEIMEIQEEILASDEDSQKQDLAKQLKEKKQDFFNQTKEKIAQKNFEEAAQNLMAAKYYNKAIKDLRAK